MGVQQRSEAVAGVEDVVLLGSVLESATECSLVATDFSGLVLTWSEGARGLYGYSSSEIVGQPVARLYRREDVAAGLLATMTARAVESGMWEGLVERLHKDGSARAARVVVTPRRGEDGETIGFLMIGFLVVARDLRLASGLEGSRVGARTMLELGSDAVMIVDPDGEIEEVNAAAEELFGYAAGELVGRQVEVLFEASQVGGGPGDRPRLSSELGWTLSMGARVELIGRGADGVGFAVQVRARPCLAGQGLASTPIRAVSPDARFDRELQEASVDELGALNAELAENVSEIETLTAEQGLLHEELRVSQGQAAESLMLVETLLLTSPVGFGFVDRDLRIRRMNEPLAALSGAPLVEQLGRTVHEVLPDLWPVLGPIYEHVLDTGEAVVNQEVQVEVRSAPGTVRNWLSSYYPVRVKDEVVGVGLVVVDITDRQQAEEFRAVVMQNLAEGLVVCDGEGRLTFMNAAASKMLGWSEYELRGKPLHAAIQYQHADGTPYPEQDGQLAKVRMDGRTVRMATDAFTRKDGSILPVAYSAGPLHSGATVRGVVVAFRDTTEEQTERARTQRALDALTWVGRIRDALDDGRMVMYSQPIVALSPTAQATEELLVRMLGTAGELILPGSFLPTAEMYGQISEIDQWVITQAALVAASGRRVHANLSADSISSLDLLPGIERALRDASADPANIVFEITETSAMGNLDAGEAFARGVKDIGCSLSLDDFGVGYGSFTYLQRLQIASLKIDSSFVRDMVSNVANQHVVKAIVNIAKGFGQQTIAEGVENVETLELLRDYGVDLVQGNHIGQPTPLQLG